MQESKKNKETFLKILRTVKGKKRYIGILLIIQVVQAALGVGYALFFRSIIDNAVSGNKEQMFKSVIGFAVLALVQLVLRAILYFLNEFTKSSIENAFKSVLFKSLLKKDYSTVTATHSGEWLNRITSDTVVVADGLTGIIPGAVATATRMLCAFVLLSFFMPKFALFLLILGIILVSVTVLFRKISKKLHIEVQKADGNLRVFLTEQMSSIMMLKSYGKEDECAEKAEDFMKNHKSKRIKRNSFLNVSNSAFSFVMNAIRVLAALFAGVLILNKTISYGTFTAVIQLLGQVQGPIANISGYAPRFYVMLASAERIFEASEYSDDVADSDFDAEEFYNNSLDSLEFKGVSFAYKTENYTENAVLENLDLKINKGETVAFKGKSGCGKSTVLKLILSLYRPDSGTAFLNTKNGEIPLNQATRGLFAYVPQGNILMNATIREVVSFFDKNIDDERVHSALRIACAEDFVSRLPEGMNTYLGERGAGLSEGEMQRISIARAIYSGRPILLLDEATSALDMETEEKLFTNIKTMTNKTIIAVTHRTKAFEYVDKIIDFN